jgi:inositol transport system substrate-binding protein
MKKKEDFARATSVLFALIAVFVVAGCAKKESGAKVFKVGYANSNDALFFDQEKKVVFEKLAAGDSSLQVIYTNANSDLQLQLDQADNFIAQKMDAIILCPVDNDGVVSAIEKANAATIPVICIGITAGGGDFIFVGTEYVDGGIRQGKYMAEHLPQNAKIVYLAGTPGYSHSWDRRAGFFDTLAAAGRSDVTLLAEQAAMYEKDKAMAIMEDWIQIYPQIDGVIAANDQMALGGLEALKGANRAQGVLVAGVDGVNEACMAIKNGEMSISILQSAPKLSQGAFETIKKIQNGQPVEKQIIIPHENITIDNVDEYLR